MLRLAADPFNVLARFVLAAIRGAFTILLVGSVAGRLDADFPNRPIKIIVYTQPGGTIDVTARRFAQVAKKYRRDATIVVENIPGASGLIAMEHLIGLQPDGYAVLACTKSNVAKAVVTGRTELLDAIDWLGLLLMDPECVVTRRDSPWSDWESLVTHAREHPGEQIWFGPGSGTMDHLMAVRIWEAFGIECRWVPHNGGARAIAALLGRQGTAYVGNPGDASNHPGLRISIVSQTKRLPQLPDTPTFAEMGHPELDQQFMWRGFALPPGCPPEVRNWYHRLFEQVTQDAQWRAHWERDGIQVGFLAEPEFPKIVEQTRAEFTRYLDRLRVAPVKGGPIVQTLSHGTTLAALVTANLAIALAVGLRGTPGFWQRRLIPLAVISICIPLLAQTWQFPPAWEGVGAAAMPRLWLFVTSGCALLTLVNPGPMTNEMLPRARLSLVAMLLAVFALQWWAAIYVGYFPSALVGTAVSLMVLGERRWQMLLGIPVGWSVGAYLLFHRLLQFDFPPGQWFS